MELKKNSRFGKGHIPWNKGKTNVFSEEAIKKMSEVKKGNKLSPEQIAKISAFHKGRKRSEETKRKISEALIGKYIGRKFPKDKYPDYGMRGKTPWNKGLKGVMISWSKGQTKETNSSLLELSKTMKGNKNSVGHTMSEKNRKAQSERMIGNTHNIGAVFTKERRENIGRANSIALKGNTIPKKVLDKMAKTKIKNGTQISPELLNEYEIYKRKVWIITRKHKKELFKNWTGYCYYTKKYILEFYDKTDYNNENYPVIDHKISIFNGFNDKIKPEIIGGIENLYICTRKINGIKRTKNNICD